MKDTATSSVETPQLPDQQQEPQQQAQKGGNAQ